MAIDPTIPIWPTLQLSPAQVSRRRLHPVNLGPEPIVGPPQSVVADAGRWELSHKRIPLHGDKLLLFRALVFHLCSPLRPVYVPIRDYVRTPRVRANVAQPAGVPFSDTAPFSDGTLFFDQAIDYVVAAPAAARATALTIAAQGAAPVELTAGQFIGLGERSHVVTQLFPSADGVATHFDLSLWPPLRAAAAIGDPGWTEDPVVKCIIDPKIVEVSEDLDMDRIGFVDLTFTEARW